MSKNFYHNLNLQLEWIFANLTPRTSLERKKASKTKPFTQHSLNQGNNKSFQCVLIHASRPFLLILRW